MRLAYDFAKVLALSIFASCGQSKSPPRVVIARSDRMREGAGLVLKTHARDALTVGTSVQATECATESLYRPRLHRLTEREIRRSVRDLFPGLTIPDVHLPAGTTEGGFDNSVNAPGFSAEETNALYEAFASVAGAAAKGYGPLTKCAQNPPDSVCVDEFVRSFGLRAFRRPLSDSETRSFVAFHSAAAAAESDATQALSRLVQAFLNSPLFLYRTEIGSPAATKSSAPTSDLTQYEIAAQLAAFLWGSFPDDALFSAAASNALSTSSQVKSQARRMLSDPRARDAIGDFFTQLLELDGLDRASRDPTRFAGFSQATARSMREEVRRFAAYAVFDGPSTFQALMTAPWGFPDGELARVYGVPPPSGGDFQKQIMVDQGRAGLLSLPAFLTAHAGASDTTPVKRGNVVAKRILCLPIPLPPKDLVITVPPDAASLTTRERFEQHSSSPQCAGCHKVLDPLGFPFESFDSIGRFRTSENGRPIDSSVKMNGVGGIEGSFRNFAAVSESFATSDQAQKCFVTNLIRFASGRAGGQTEARARDALHGTFRDSGYELKELMISIAGSEQFLKRGSKETCEGKKP